jgi:hypothetical protein
MVNAIRLRWWNPEIDLEAVVQRFAADPLAEGRIATTSTGRSAGRFSDNTFPHLVGQVL